MKKNLLIILLTAPVMVLGFALSTYDSIVHKNIQVANADVPAVGYYDNIGGGGSLGCCEGAGCCN